MGGPALVAEEEVEKTDGGGAEAEAEAVTKKGEKGAAAPSGPNQKLVLLVLILNAVGLLGVAVLLYKVVSRKSSGEVSLGDIATQKEGGGEHAGEEHKKEGGEKGEGKKKEGEPDNSNFIKESFTVNLKESKGSHFAKVDVEIEVEDDFVKEEVNRLRPRIRDFILVMLSSKSYEQIESVDGRDFLREEIRNKINGYLSRGSIKNVYFTQFIIQ